MRTAKGARHGNFIGFCKSAAETRFIAPSVPVRLRTPLCVPEHFAQGNAASPMRLIFRTGFSILPACCKDDVSEPAFVNEQSQMRN